MKYYLAQIKDKIMDRDFTTTVRFRIEDGAEEGADTKADNIASVWWGDEAIGDTSGYYFDGGRVFTSVWSVIEVNEEVYNAVAMIISDLT